MGLDASKGNFSAIPLRQRYICDRPHQSFRQGGAMRRRSDHVFSPALRSRSRGSRYARAVALGAAAGAVVLSTTAGRCSATTTQAYCAITGTFTSSADSVDVNFSFDGVGSLLFAGHARAGGTNVAGDAVRGGGVDSEIKLFDSLGNLLANDGDGGPGADPLLSVSPLSAGTYRAQSHLADPARPL